MKKEYTKDIVGYAYYGIDDNIAAEATAVVNLRDLMKVQATLAELIQFFHQPLHMQTLGDVQEYLGSVNTKGALELLHRARSELITPMLPNEIQKLIENGVFDAPTIPHYFQPKN